MVNKIEHGKDPEVWVCFTEDCFWMDLHKRQQEQHNAEGYLRSKQEHYNEIWTMRW